MESNVLTAVSAENPEFSDSEFSDPEFSDYVAHLQLHMSLQARNLVPTLKQTVEDSRQQLLHQTQAQFEKLASRQKI